MKNGIPQMTVQELKTTLDKRETHNDNFLLLDVREPYEYQIAQIGGYLIPQNDVANRLGELDKNRRSSFTAAAEPAAKRSPSCSSRTASKGQQRRRRHPRLGRRNRPQRAEVLNKPCTGKTIEPADNRRLFFFVCFLAMRRGVKRVLLQLPAAKVFAPLQLPCLTTLSCGMHTPLL